ncbi:MAG: restriction endonuclease [Clostridiales bacterium]|jgi:hypothetical protein|nr:restriction endonuclease [Clostridiales bacterium]
MNIWTENSIKLANQKNYLDLLYKIYPMSINLRRELSDSAAKAIETHFNNKDNLSLLKILLKNDIFPLKDSYVAYLKKDNSAIDRNPLTVDRLSGMLYELGLDEIIERSSAPKETNRQIGPLFRQWIQNGSLGVKVTENSNEFLNYDGNIVLNSYDEAKKEFAEKYLGYSHNKGLDFIAKFNNKYVIAEAKFLTDFGGHQDAQYADAISTLKTNLKPTKYNVIKIAILDGVLFINCGMKTSKSIRSDFDDSEIILSAVLLRDFLFSL